MLVTGPFVKLQLLVPGETAAPGPGSGKTGTPTTQGTGTAFTVTVNAVDTDWYVVSSTHTVGITSSDGSATLPATAALAGGTKTFSVTLTTAGQMTVPATDIPDGPKPANPSPLFTVLARPIFDAASSAGGSATPLTWSHTVAAGSNGLLIVGVSTGDAVTTHNTVTYNTVPMTKISEVTGASDRVSIWTLVNPATGTKSVVVTLSAATNVKGGATSWTNVNQTTPVGTAATNTGSSNFPSVTVASAAEEVVHDTIGANADTDEGAVTADAGQTERWNIRTTHTGAGSTEVGAASVTMSWTMVKNTSWAIVGVPIKPAHVFAKLQLLVPGETAAAGAGSGKTGTPTAQTAGTAFTVTVNGVDANWNVITSVTDTVGITSTDTNATLPGNAALASGTQTFNVTLKTGGTNLTLTASDITNGLKSPNTSPGITVSVLAPTAGEVSSSQTGGTSTTTWAHTTSGTNRVLVVGVSCANITTRTVGSVTYDNVAMTIAASAVNAGNAGAEIFYLVAPAAGSNTVSVTLSGSANSLVGGAVTLTGVNQTTPLGTFASATGSSIAPSVNATSNTGETVIDTVSLTSSGAITVFGGQTQQWQAGTSGRGAGSTKPGASSVTMSWNSANLAWAIGAVGVKPVATCSSVSDATYVTAETQGTQATVYWGFTSSSNPVLILRQTAAFGSEAPSSGASYNVNEAIGAATVVFKGTSGTDTWFTDTGLTAGTTYYYKIFPKTSLPCYAPGITVSVSPVASAVWGYSTTAASMIPPALDPWSNVVIIGSNDDSFHGMADSDGTLKFAPVGTGNPIQARPATVPAGYRPPTGAGGNIAHVTPQDGSVYAWDTG